MSVIKLLIDRGACRGSRDPRFLIEGDLERVPDPEVAAVCARCPVRETCLAYALETEDDGDEVGVWGGTTPYQRRQLKVVRSRVLCPSCRSDAVQPVARGEVCISCGASWLA